LLAVTRIPDADHHRAEKLFVDGLLPLPIDRLEAIADRLRKSVRAAAIDRFIAEKLAPSLATTLKFRPHQFSSAELTQIHRT